MFSRKVITALILILLKFSAAIQLECKYFSGDYCRVSLADLSKQTVNETFTISSSHEQKEKTTELKFTEIGKVYHIPKSICRELPNLTKFGFWSSKVPIVRNEFFQSEFAKIQELDLIYNGIQSIEDGALMYLPNLVDIYLAHNEIRSLNGAIFERNRKLERIYLQGNKINIIDPQAFKNFKQLKYINLQNNECTDQFFECQNCSAGIVDADLILGLHHCYEYYTKKLDLLNDCEYTFISKNIAKDMYSKVQHRVQPRNRNFSSKSKLG